MKRTYLLLVAILALLPNSTFAHHVVDGQLPSTFSEGLMSGLAHPVIGPDHLLFILVLGLFSVLLNKTIGIYSFVGGTVAGTVYHLMSYDIPSYETIVAATLIALAVFMYVSKLHKVAPVAVFFGLAGVFHGYAYGESIIGANPMPLVSYLSGFAVIQIIVCLAAFYIFKKTFGTPEEGSKKSVYLKATLSAICVAASSFFIFG